MDEYNFADQGQQSPAPLGGGLVKAEWFKRYSEKDRPEHFDRTAERSSSRFSIGRSLTRRPSSWLLRFLQP